MEMFGKTRNIKGRVLCTFCSGDASNLNSNQGKDENEMKMKMKKKLDGDLKAWSAIPGMIFLTTSDEW